MGQKHSQIYCDCMPKHECFNNTTCSLHNEYIALYKVAINLTRKLTRAEADKQFGIWWGSKGWVPADVKKDAKNWYYICYACPRCINNKRQAPTIEYSEVGFIDKQLPPPVGWV